MQDSASIEREKIAKLAYELWEKAGRPHGSGENFWLEAEKQVRAKAVIAKKPRVTPSEN